ncbi:exodeoxyribonuclease VII large subunit [Methanosphaera sp.]|uniref:exodeoxyribonuclease VII large subunit n=1 Tax=Methanosphaera sp. TaxID=2666342 RepID=UPI0026E0F87A|nr:exodeoxyribonuclease VII large subunit [Methanosphaera sp.]MDO5822868.1 exodeoxyribonuclease VII large subunit [Methanosphaera sp.]
MHDKEIFKITLTTTILGLIGLIILSGYVNPEELSVNEIDKSKIDNQVKVTGIIENYTITKTGTMIVTLNDGSDVIKVVIFPSTSLNTTLYNGMNITVTAKVVEYNGEMELIIEKSKNLEINS